MGNGRGGDGGGFQGGVITTIRVCGRDHCGRRVFRWGFADDRCVFEVVHLEVAGLQSRCDHEGGFPILKRGRHIKVVKRFANVMAVNP